MCEATKQWEEKIRNDVIDMMGVRKEGEEHLQAAEAIERLKAEGILEGEAKGRNTEKKEIAEKMRKKGYSTKEIEELTGILLH